VSDEVAVRHFLILTETSVERDLAADEPVVASNLIVEVAILILVGCSPSDGTSGGWK
jgi:hypothetical protein